MSRIRLPFPSPRQQASSGRPGSGFKARLIIAIVIALFAVLSYYGRPGDENQVTGEVERVAMTEEADEVQMGLQAVPEMAQMHGGRHPDARAAAHVRQVGEKLLAALDGYLVKHGRHNPYRENFNFTLLADPKTVNAFALPGGQIFITGALYRELETEGQLAGVLGHEIGHVIERHSNQRMAKEQLFQGLAAAGGIAGGDQQSAQMAQAVAQMVSMKYGREDELESDKWGVRLTEMAGYDPRAMIGLMEVLDRASGGAGPPEFMSTHPKPANREEYIKHVIADEFPNGLRPGLEP
ncbi:MAG: M48 family metallopeptidase [Pirellulales bacterium]|nr:M48 family metallopeptidase [Pirellulales bacterium]